MNLDNANNATRAVKYSPSVSPTAKEAKQEWRCGLYLRLSREDGDKAESDSIANQRKILEGFIGKNPDLRACDFYIDDGVSGTHFNRKQVMRLLDDIKNRKINCLIVKDLSRFGRDKIEMARYLEIVFPLLRVRVISVTESIDSYRNPESLKNALVSFKIVMNDEYCRDISNKVKRSFDMKRKRGDFIGSFASYGYMKSPENRHRLVVDPEAAEVVKQIYAWFLNGASIFNICRLLYQEGIANPTEYRIKKGLKTPAKPLTQTKGAWQRRTVQRMLQNRLYAGDLIQRKYEKISHKLKVCRPVPKERHIVRANNHEPIIDIQTFERTQELFKFNRRQSKTGDVHQILSAVTTKAGANIFAGYIKCADCGRAMTRNKIARPAKTYYYFCCTSYIKWRQCFKRTIRSDALEQTVLTVIQKYIDTAVEMEKIIGAIDLSSARNAVTDRLNKAVKAKEAEKVRLKSFLNELYPDMKNGLITKEQYLQFKADTEAAVAKIDLSLESLNQQLVKEKGGINGSDDFITGLKKFGQIKTLTREVIAGLIKMIYIEKNGGVKIEFRFQDEYMRAVEYIEAHRADGKDCNLTKTVAV